MFVTTASIIEYAVRYHFQYILNFDALWFFTIGKPVTFYSFLIFPFLPALLHRCSGRALWKENYENEKVPVQCYDTSTDTGSGPRCFTIYYISEYEGSRLLCR